MLAVVHDAAPRRNGSLSGGPIACAATMISHIRMTASWLIRAQTRCRFCPDW